VSGPPASPSPRGAASAPDWSGFRRIAVAHGNRSTEMPAALYAILERRGVSEAVIDQVRWLMLEPMPPAPPPTHMDPWPDPRPGVGATHLYSAEEIFRVARDHPWFTATGLLIFASGSTGDVFAVDLTEEIGRTGIYYGPDVFGRRKEIRSAVQPLFDDPVSCLSAAAERTLPDCFDFNASSRD